MTDTKTVEAGERTQEAENISMARGKCTRCDCPLPHPTHPARRCTLKEWRDMAYPDIESLINTVVGKVRVVESVEYTDKGYECAAWWQTRVGAPGVYDVYLRRDPYDKNRIYFSASLSATVKEDSFQSLFCGNLIGRPYDTKQNAGKPCQNVEIGAEFVQTICRSNNSDDRKTKWVIFRELYSLFLAYCHRQLADTIASFPMWADKYVQTPHDEFDSNAGMVAHFGEKMAFYGRAIHEIACHIKFDKDGKYYTANNPFLAEGGAK